MKKRHFDVLLVILVAASFWDPLPSSSSCKRHIVSVASIDLKDLGDIRVYKGSFPLPLASAMSSPGGAMYVLPVKDHKAFASFSLELATCVFFLFWKVPLCFTVICCA